MRKLVMALTFVALVAAVVLVTATPSQAHCRSYKHSYGEHYYGYGCGYYGYDPDYGYNPYPYGYGPYWPVPPVMIPQTPPVVIQPAPPTTYIEKPAEQKQPEQKQTEQYLSYCKKEDKFYPEIGECSGGWLKVVSSPVTPEDAKRYWKLCRKARNFYPYVEECPAGWLYVIPETTPPK